jgi:hypothetical protein
MWKIGNRSFLVKHQLSQLETAMVHTDSRMEDTGPAAPAGGADYDARLEAAAVGVER